jgi:hypothetical protein
MAIDEDLELLDDGNPDLRMAELPCYPEIQLAGYRFGWSMASQI